MKRCIQPARLLEMSSKLLIILIAEYLTVLDFIIHQEVKSGRPWLTAPIYHYETDA